MSADLTLRPSWIAEPTANTASRTWIGNSQRSPAKSTGSFWPIGKLSSVQQKNICELDDLLSSRIKKKKKRAKQTWFQWVKYDVHFIHEHDTFAPQLENVDARLSSALWAAPNRRIRIGFERKHFDELEHQRAHRRWSRNHHSARVASTSQLAFDTRTLRERRTKTKKRNKKKKKNENQKQKQCKIFFFKNKN